MKPISKICLALLAIALLVGLTTPVFAGGEIKGKVMSVDPDNLSFVIETANKGRVLPFELDEDASVFINNQEKSIQELKAGDDVSIVHRRYGDKWYAIVIRCERQ